MKFVDDSILFPVFLSTQRRHFEQIKVAIPVIIKVLKDTLSESEGELEDFFDRPITIAESIHGVCIKLVCYILIIPKIVLKISRYYLLYSQSFLYVRKAEEMKDCVRYLVYMFCKYW